MHPDRRPTITPREKERREHHLMVESSRLALIRSYEMLRGTERLVRPGLPIIPKHDRH